MKTIQLDIA